MASFCFWPPEKSVAIGPGATQDAILRQVTTEIEEKGFVVAQLAGALLAWGVARLLAPGDAAEA